LVTARWSYRSSLGQEWWRCEGRKISVQVRQ
jgi:hypothetical protein